MILKKTLSWILATGTLLSAVPVMAEETAVSNPEKTVYYTDVFEGNPTYLMEDPFQGSNGQSPDGKVRPTGWDVDYRGGTINKVSNGLAFYDTSTTESLRMTKKILPHKDGKVTFDTAFRMIAEQSSGVTLELSGGGKAAARFVIEGEDVYLYQQNNNKVSIGKQMLDSVFTLKAVLDMYSNRVEIYVDGKYVGEYDFTEKCSVLEQVEVRTPVESTASFELKFVNMYINYLVNERFMTASGSVIPDPWEVKADADVAYIEKMNSGNVDDQNSLTIKDKFTFDKAFVKRSFDPQTGDLVAEARFIAQPDSDNYAFSLNFGEQIGIRLTAKNNNFYTTDNKLVYENYLDNLWYYVKFVADIENHTADIYLNYKLVAEDVPFVNNLSTIDNITIETGRKETAVVTFDDIIVYEDRPLPKDYVPTPQPVESEGADLAMLMYSMWREGIHYGWDRISPYENRKPYTGWYTEGSPEVADWDIKWLTEHGFDYQVFTWSRENGNANKPVKVTQRHNALMDGYLNAEYSHMMKYALLWSYIFKGDTLGGVEDFKENVVPYWLEYHFKDPRYMLVDNKPIIYIYTWKYMEDVFGTPDVVKQAFDYLDQACKDAGFDGVMIVGDGSGAWKESGATYEFTYTTGHKASSLDTMKSTIDKRCESSVLGYVPSIAMGWSTEPWITGEVGKFAEPETIGALTKYAIEKFDELEEKGIENPRQIIYTCWNEWGEGHFFCPSTAHGFGYLQETRNAATNAGYNPNEAMPTDRALARLQVLYPPERQALKIMNDVSTTPDPEDVYVLKGWYFDNPDDYAEWSIYKEIEYIKNEDGKLIGKSSNIDPRIANENINIPLDNVAGIRSNLWVDGGSVGMFIYRTDLEPTYGAGKRFDAKLTEQGYAEYFAAPTNASKLTGATMTGLFFDPDDNLYRDFGDFGLEYIEILAWKTPRLNYYLDGLLINEICTPKEKDGVAFMSAYRTLESLDADCSWDNATKTFTLKKDGKTIIMKDQSNVANINGTDIEMPGATYYNNGHFMVPIYFVCDELGITVTNEAPVVETVSRVANEYEFNVNGDMEGWKTIGVDSSQVKDGEVTLVSSGNDPIIQLDKTEFKSSDYRYIKVRMKNTTGATTAMMYFITQAEKNWGGGKRVDAQVTETTEYTEYVFDMSTCDKWTGIVTGLRFDPTSNPGTTYIDYIKAVKNP